MPPCPPRSPHARGPLGTGARWRPRPAFSPLYQQIKALITAKPAIGRMETQATIPSEMELAARFQSQSARARCARPSTNWRPKICWCAARATGHVCRHPCRATRSVPVSQADSRQRRRQQEGPAQRRIIDCKRVRAPRPTWRARSGLAGDAVLQVRRVLSFSGVPHHPGDIWLPGTPSKD